MAYSREIFTIAKRKENKNGNTYWKGGVDVNGKKMSITVYPSSDGNNAKISVWPWSGGYGMTYRRR